jgi:hypothetical protein
LIRSAPALSIGVYGGDDLAYRIGLVLCAALCATVFEAMM